MRTLTFFVAALCGPTIFAAEVTLHGIYADGKLVELDDPPGQCTFVEVEKANSGKSTLLDCTESTVPALKGATYILDEEATQKNNKGADPVYRCIRGCARGVVRTIKYTTEESGC